MEIANGDDVATDDNGKTNWHEMAVYKNITYISNNNNNNNNNNKGVSHDGKSSRQREFATRRYQSEKNEFRHHKINSLYRHRIFIFCYSDVNLFSHITALHETQTR